MWSPNNMLVNQRSAESEVKLAHASMLNSLCSVWTLAGIARGRAVLTTARHTACEPGERTQGGLTNKWESWG